MRKERALVLKLAAADWFLKRRWAAHYELGVQAWGRRRADVFGLSVRGAIDIVEVKSCLADITADKKWRDYLNYCDQFYFCIGWDTWAKSKTKIKTLVAGSGAGVLVLEDDGYARVKIKAKKNTLSDESRFALMARAAYRSAEVRRPKNRRQRRLFDPKS